MMINLLDVIKPAFSSELTGHLAARLGESTTGIGKALRGIVPLVLSGLVNRVGAGDVQPITGAELRAYFAPIGTVGAVTGILGILGSGTEAGSPLLEAEKLLVTLFGASSGMLASSIQDYAGIRTDSAHALLRLVGAVLPALIGQHVAVHNLTISEISVQLSALKKEVRDMLPPSLYGLTSLLGLSGMRTELRTASTLRTVLPLARQAAVWLGTFHLAWYHVKVSLGG